MNPQVALCITTSKSPILCPQEEESPAVKTKKQGETSKEKPLNSQVQKQLH